MSDTLFFTLDDVRDVRKNVSVNIDDFDQYGKEVQRNYVEKLLGQKLYAALLDDLTASIPQTARFVDLVNGINYTSGGDTIIYRGLKIYCSYLWLHLYMGMGGTNHTPIGTQLFKDDAANHNEASQVNRNAAAHYIKSADQLEEPILRFLIDHISDYPEFSQSSQIEQAERDNFSFKALGTTYRDPYNLY
jgi:hypothetical protein